MPLSNKSIVILTSGGDAPGMNAAIRAIVRTAYYYGLKVHGAIGGYQGLVDEKLMLLTPNSVANCIQEGGTLLKTDRALGFHKKSIRKKCFTFLQKEKIDAMIVIGGNGTFKGAALFAKEHSIPVIGIPATIDNDITHSEYTIGFDTACNTALQAIDKIRDTASSHNRHFLVEVMGRNTGFLAIDVGIAGGAEIILIPEKTLSLNQLTKKILAPKRAKLSSIIVVSEANKPGRSFQLADELRKRTKLNFRVCILGHTQRGGTPTPFDRKIAAEMGFLAVKAILHDKTQQFTALQKGKINLAPFPKKANRRFNDFNLLKMNDILCL